VAGQRHALVIIVGSDGTWSLAAGGGRGEISVVATEARNSDAAYTRAVR
jgi:hypothetical protein